MTTAQKAVAAFVGTLARYLTGLVLLGVVVLELVGEMIVVLTGRTAVPHEHRPAWLVVLLLGVAVACLVPSVADYIWKRVRPLIPSVSLKRGG